MSEEFGTSDVYITVPNPSIITDEDSEDVEEGGILDNLSGPQLALTTELVFSKNSRIGEFINYHKKQRKCRLS